MLSNMTFLMIFAVFVQSPLVLVGVASAGTVGAFRLHYPPVAPQESRTNNDGVL